MKKNLYSVSAIALLSILVVSSCSKDKSLEDNLQKVKTWKVEKINYQKAQAGLIATNARIGVEYSAGTMTFNDDGTGSYDYTLDGYHRVDTYDWNLSKKNITFNYAAADLNGAHAATYNVIFQSKNAVTFQGDEALVDSSGAFALNAIFYLKK